MWIKYLIIIVDPKSCLSLECLRIGLKFNEDSRMCIIGGQKRMINKMQMLIETFFGISMKEVKVTFPQTYKIRMAFICTEEMRNKFNELIKNDKRFLIYEVNVLGRKMR